MPEQRARSLEAWLDRGGLEVVESPAHQVQERTAARFSQQAQRRKPELTGSRHAAVALPRILCILRRVRTIDRRRQLLDLAGELARKLDERRELRTLASVFVLALP